MSTINGTARPEGDDCESCAMVTAKYEAFIANSAESGSVRTTAAQRVIPTAVDSFTNGDTGEINLHLYTTAGDGTWAAERVTHILDLTPDSARELIQELQLALTYIPGEADAA